MVYAIKVISKEVASDAIDNKKNNTKSRVLLVGIRVIWVFFSEQ
jgi:hypothetical protein